MIHSISRRRLYVNSPPEVREGRLMTRSIGLAHLSALQLTPPELVDAAADYGFNSVGVRVHPATPSENSYPMSLGSPMSVQTLARLEDTGLTVFDVEVFTLDGVRGRDEWMPVLEAGATLGARILNVIGGDDNPRRMTDSLAALVRDAREFGITASIEPISYQQINTFRIGATIAEQTGCGIMLDVLHFVRSGGTISDLVAAPKGSVQVIQLCDGPATVLDLTPPTRMPLGQDTNGSARQIESRAERQVPGEGAFPLVDILRALPGVPISVEVPDVTFVETRGIAAHLKRIFAATHELVTTSDSERQETLR
ncbi:sugar phosphate isomerase/epimerase family protein [Nocardia sp. NPDC051750]|uniref:sugar phosphate isomerase/epimerase family protein n=1 Tax=Nocardia sp. NPDC051750 TaxID=3364325 RepID=UPI00378E42AF